MFDFLESFLFGAAATTGGGWSLTFAGAVEPWLRTVVLLVALAVVVMSWMGLRRLPSTRMKFLAILLRCVATAVLVIMILQPQVQREETARVKNKVALVFDASKSMGVKVGGYERFDSVRGFLKENGAFLKRLDRDFDVDYLSFSDPGGLKGGLKEVRGGEAAATDVSLEGQATDIAGLLRAINKRYRGKHVSGILLSSDGRDTTGGPEEEKLEEVEKVAKELPAPVFTFGPPQERYKDIAITELVADSFAFIRNPWNIRVTLRVRGYDNVTLPVTLKEGGKIILSKPLKIEPGKEEYVVTMKTMPYSTGKALYTVTVPPLADELVSENNTASVLLHVIRDKIRVLHLCGRPSWDELFLRRILKEDPSVDLISFFILRTPNDLVEAASHELSLIPFPAEELFTQVLDSFDLVIFQNFDYRPYDSTYLRFSYYMANIREFVTETGGAFIMVGGDLSFSHGGYDRTPVEDILPVDLDEAGDRIDTGSFRPVLTAEGRTHPITTLEYDDARNRRVWEKFPELDGCNMVGNVKEGAVVLGLHPVHKRPVLAIRDVGKGRTMALLTDGSWKWNFLSVAQGGSNRHYMKFWNNAIRWLVKDPELDLVRVVPQKEEYLPGEEVHLKAEVFGSDYKPLPGAQLAVEVVNAETGEKVLEKTMESDSRGQVRFSYKDLPAGFYRARVRAFTDRGELGEASGLFGIISKKEELRELKVDEALLKRVAGASGGRYFRLPVSDIYGSLHLENPEVFRLLGRKTYTLWDSWLLFIIVLGCLAGEWWMRKMARY
ncbi:MAG: glutamine amidotransferase [Candidatus Bathyanammoxibius sp.]